MKMILDALCLILFGSTAIRDIVLMVLYRFGVWGVLQKSGVKGWWSLIPGARDYMLARCAGREAEGRLYSLTDVADIAMGLLSMLFIRSNSGERFALAAPI